MATNLSKKLSSSAASRLQPRNVLTIGAHPDDAEFGAGAALARWAAGGADITILVVTDGSKGSLDKNQDRNALVAKRKAEQRAAADVLGVTECIHLSHTDGELEYSMALRAEIALIIRSVRPDTVLSHDPWQRYQLHPDHRATGFAAVDGVVSAREPLALSDSGTEAHRPSQLLLWSPDEPDHVEPMTGQDEAKKLEALLCHSSQGATTMGDPKGGTDRMDAFKQQLADWHEANGKPFAEGHAEVFKKLIP